MKGKLQFPNPDRIISIPIGHYSIIKLPSKVDYLAIYGLGSCIALILYDKKHEISAMSHILLPYSKKGDNIDYPHKFADLSLLHLRKEIIELGAKQQEMKAIIIGGANIFRSSHNKIGDDNITSIEAELTRFDIPIIKKDLGGHRGRGLLFDVNNFKVSIRFTGDSQFKKL